MPKYRVAIIGTGRRHGTPGATGWGMAHEHMRGYKASVDCQLVAMADIRLENADLFQKEYGGEAIFQDFRQMLAETKPDIISVCTWPHSHCEIVLAAAEAGVKAIHCEKPMALNYGDARRMVQTCEQHAVQLTFNHQRRFDEEFRKARELANSGAIGKLIRVEGVCPNLYDWGTHWFDMCFFYNNENPVEWVIGQVEPRGGHTVYNVQHEEQGLSYFNFSNGVKGLLLTGHATKFAGINRLYGEEGMLELDMTRRPQLRMWGKGMKGWQSVKTDEVHATSLGILNLIEALKTGQEPELSGKRALKATELIFATYESARIGGRVELPLQIEDSPLVDILERSERQ